MRNARSQPCRRRGSDRVW